MLYTAIAAYRNKLDNMILNGEDKEKIYELSVKLDQLIVKYYCRMGYGGKRRNGYRQPF